MAFNLQITEIWAGQDGDDLTGDWFEITNFGDTAWVSGVDAGLYYDDESAEPGDAVLISGLSQIGAGETAIVVLGTAGDDTTFFSVWNPDIDLTGVGIGLADGAGLGDSGDAVTLWAGDPTGAGTIADIEAYPSQAGNSGRSYDVSLAAYSEDGNAAGAVETSAEAGTGGDEPAAGSPGLVFAPDQLVISQDPAAFEGDTGSTDIIFTVMRSTDSTGAASVDFAVTGSDSRPADAADFGGTLPSGTVEFADGEYVKTITVPVSGDTVVEGNETFTVTLSNATGATIATGSSDATIRNDDVDGAPQAGGAITQTNAATIALAGAEIVAFAPDSGNYFVTSSSGLQIVDGSDPFGAGLSLVATIDPTTFENPLTPGVNFDSAAFTSVTIRNGLVAAALPDATKTDAGSVLFFDAADGTFRGAVQVGILPDSLTFSEDGLYVVVANESESAGDANQPASLPNPDGSVSIIAVNAADPAASTVQTFDFSDASITAEALVARGARVNPDAPSVAADIEPEYVSIHGNQAFITLQENNAVAVIDDIANFSGFTIDDIQGLGFKDHSLPGNSLDTSDRDGGIAFSTHDNLFGIYMPDTIASYSAGGSTYYVTANEGDDREVDSGRVGDLTLDPTAFPDAAALQENDVLGRLTVSLTEGDTDDDGDYDALYVLGARSFTIRDEAGAIVFDSGNMLELITADMMPEFFNADDGDAAEFDNRSDNKGPEPEALTIGEVGGHTYAFVGLERGPGGVLAFDITDPNDVSYQGYFNAPGDISPEGLAFTGADHSPTGEALLAVANEVSNTLTVYEFDAAIDVITGDDATDDTFDFSDYDTARIVDGKGGSDSVGLAGTFADFTIEAIEDGFRFTPATGEPLDLLSIETVSFDDQTITLVDDPDLAAIDLIYDAAYDRTGDVAGLTFWYGQHEDGLSVQDIAGFFPGADEFEQLYDGISNMDFVENVYENALERSADDAGKAFWTGQLDDGEIDRGDMIFYFATSEEAMATSDNLIDDGVFIFA